MPHAVRLEAGRAYIEETAERLDADEESLQTEGAIAKYLATEAGNAACEAAIQALGGYGYTREYEVEKRKRDVRITTIYEGTSEIMEMTISRDRWQQHLKTRGQHYHDQAQELEALHAARPTLGAGRGGTRTACPGHAPGALPGGAAHPPPARALPRGRARGAGRGRSGAAPAGPRAPPNDSLDERADARFTPEALAAVSRVFSREAALDVATNGLRWVLGGDPQAADAAAFAGALGLPAIQAAQFGLIADMDLVADALYGRAPASASPPSST